MALQPININTDVWADTELEEISNQRPSAIAEPDTTQLIAQESINLDTLLIDNEVLHLLGKDDTPDEEQVQGRLIDGKWTMPEETRKLRDMLLGNH